MILVSQWYESGISLVSEQCKSSIRAVSQWYHGDFRNAGCISEIVGAMCILEIVRASEILGVSEILGSFQKFSVNFEHSWWIPETLGAFQKLGVHFRNCWCILEFLSASKILGAFRIFSAFLRYCWWILGILDTSLEFSVPNYRYLRSSLSFSEFLGSIQKLFARVQLDFTYEKTLFEHFSMWFEKSLKTFLITSLLPFFSQVLWLMAKHPFLILSNAQLVY